MWWSVWTMLIGAVGLLILYQATNTDRFDRLVQDDSDLVFWSIVLAAVLGGTILVGGVGVLIQGLQSIL